MHELQDRDLEAVGVGAEGRHVRLQPRHVAVVVGTERDDEQVEAALELVLGVGHVCCEVRRLAGRALEDAVLVVAEVRRAQPQRALGAVQMALLRQPLDAPLDGTRAAFVQCGLVEEDVVLDAVGAQRGLDALEHQLDADARELVGVHLGGARDLRGQPADVIADVAALGHLLPARPRANRLAEPLDLRPGVVEVVLARDRVAGKAEHARQRVAVRGMRRCGRQRPGQVGRDELDVDAQRGGRAPPPPKPSPAASTQSSASTYHGSGEKEVQEARPGDLHALQGLAEPVAQRSAQPLGDLARRRLEQRREDERRVGRVVAVIGLLRALQRGRRLRRPAVGQAGGRRRDRGTQVGDRGHERVSVRGGTKRDSRRCTVRNVPIAITTSPALSTVDEGGWGWNVPSAERTPTMIAPPRMSAI